MTRFEGRIPSLALPPLLLALFALACDAILNIMPGGRSGDAVIGYLPLHSILEIMSIAVSLMVFSLGWTARHSEHSDRNLILGIAGLMAATFDVFHMLSFPGMPPLVTPSGMEKSINLWLLGRLAMALGMLLACFPGPRRWIHGHSWIGLVAAGGLTSTAVAVSLASPVFLPRTFVPGVGLTPFKVGMEYGLAVLYITASSLLLAGFRRTRSRDELKLAGAAGLLALTEVLLTLYHGSSDLPNLLGHVGKAMAYILIYDSLFATGVQAPYGALAKEKALLRTLMDAVPDLIFFKDSQSRYLGYNRAFAAYCGRNETEMLGKTDDEFVPPDVAEFYRSKDRAAMAAGRPSSNEEWIDYPDGQRVLLETIKAPIFDQAGTLLGLVGLSRDITGRHSAEEGLRRAHYELEMVASVAAHDLQEPARTIASFLQLLQLRYGDKLGEDADQYIRYAVEGAHRMREQLAGLLEYTQVERGERPVTMAEAEAALDQALANLAPAIRASGAVISRDRLPAVNADPEQLRILFQNLLGNAVKYAHPDRNPEIRIWAERANGHWNFSVADNGIGIDPQYWDKIFVVFQRLHPVDRYGGTGIGLAICKKIVERHGGQIRVESQPGQGSTFSFTLPVRA